MMHISIHWCIVRDTSIINMLIAEWILSNRGWTSNLRNERFNLIFQPSQSWIPSSAILQFILWSERYPLHWHTVFIRSEKTFYTTRIYSGRKSDANNRIISVSKKAKRGPKWRKGTEVTSIKLHYLSQPRGYFLIFVQILLQFDENQIRKQDACELHFLKHLDVPNIEFHRSQAVRVSHETHIASESESYLGRSECDSSKG